MKPSEMEAIYQEACRAASNRPVPEQAQLKIWKQIMGGFDAGDIRGGLALWWATEKYLPMPAELKPLAERARRERLSKSSETTEFVGWYCDDCGIRLSGFLPVGADSTRACKGIPKDRPATEGEVCGAIMREVYRCDSKEINKRVQRA